MKPGVTVLNGTFDPLTAEQTVDTVFAWLRAGQRGWLCTVNVSTLVAMRGDAALRSFVARARLVVADGQPLVWCAPLFGGRLPERVAGIELVDALCARAASERASVYLLGATSRVVHAAIERLRATHPGLVIDGADGYFTAAEAPARAAAILTSGASVLLVGMGSPLQETFIDTQWERLGVGLAIGVGGSFDVLAGLRMRAPRWVRSAGLEWLVRLAQEPARLLPRYVATNTVFCTLILGALFARMKQWIVAH